MAEHLSVTQFDREVKKLKRNLEGWREIILPLHSVLVWEKSSYLGIIVAATSLVFLLLWHLDPSFLTMISFMGLIVTTMDYFVPILTTHFFPPDNWTAPKERKLESICITLTTKKVLIVNSVKSFYQLRFDRPKMYYFVVITTLLMLSWIGNAVNNLFLSYLLVNALLLLPGLLVHGHYDKCKFGVYKFLTQTFGNAPCKKQE